MYPFHCISCKPFKICRNTPCDGNTERPVKDVGISVVPSPPEKLDAQDVKGHIEKSVGEAHGKWLTPAGQLQAVDGNVSGVVEAGIWGGGNGGEVHGVHVARYGNYSCTPLLM